MKRRRYAGGDAVENNPNTQKYNAATPHRRLPISFPTDIMRQCRMDFPVFMRFSLCSFHSLISFKHYRISAFLNSWISALAPENPGIDVIPHISYLILHISYLLRRFGNTPIIAAPGKPSIFFQISGYQSVSPHPGHAVAWPYRRTADWNLGAIHQHNNIPAV